jgi:hypothetical protein
VADCFGDEGDAAAVPMPTTAWHVTSSVNRQSILEYGLDWRRMAAVGGVASGVIYQGPEMDAVFLLEAPDQADFFIGFGTHPRFDVWQVDVTGLVIEPGPDGWVMHRQPIAPQRLRLVRQDVSVSPATRYQDADMQVDAQVTLRDSLSPKKREP